MDPIRRSATTCVETTLHFSGSSAVDHSAESLAGEKYHRHKNRSFPANCYSPKLRRAQFIWPAVFDRKPLHTTYDCRRKSRSHVISRCASLDLLGMELASPRGIYAQTFVAQVLFCPKGFVVPNRYVGYVLLSVLTNVLTLTLAH